MPYTIHVTCQFCGRKSSYSSDDAPFSWRCPLCPGPPDLTDEEAEAENDKDDS